MDEEDLYEIIGVRPDATEEAIRKAYLRLALKLHPDKHTEENRSKATQAFTRMKNAYDVLIDEKQRKKYDFRRSCRETGGPPSTQNRKTAHESTRGDSFRRQSASSKRPRESRQGSGFRNNGTSSQHSGNKSESYSRTSRTQHTASHGTSRTQHPRSQGTSSNQQRCGSPPRTSRASHHENQPRTNSSKNSSQHASSSRQRVFGVRKDGQPCLRCIQQGRYCYQHVHQEDPTWSKPKTSSGHAKERVYGIRLDGQPCKRCMEQGDYCHQHESQEKGRRQRDFPKVTSFGVCQDGRPCKRCIQQGRYCYQHQYQQAS